MENDWWFTFNFYEFFKLGASIKWISSFIAHNLRMLSIYAQASLTFPAETPNAGSIHYCGTIIIVGALSISLDDKVFNDSVHPFQICTWNYR